jgi:signal recognition particle subunit SRP54
MFGSLTTNLSKIFDKLKGRGFIDETAVNEAAREIRVALLEADVALPVAKEFINRIKEKAIGQEVLKSISPGQMVVKIVSDELTAILAAEDTSLNLATQPPAVIMMLGLQGSGKTTTTAKLAFLLKNKQKKKVLIASLDTYRPAAMEQLEITAKQIQIDSLEIIKDETPVVIAKRALAQAKHNGYDVLILDTAGRLHNDDVLIAELKEIDSLTNPIEKLLVADSLTGQDAVNIAKNFHENVGITGIVLTRVDGDSRGGAALSMRYITGCPIKFLGVGEKPSDLEEFDASRIAARILDKGDIVGLVEKAQEFMSEQESERLASKLKRGSFDMNDLLSQLKSVKKLGGVGKLLGMIPGAEKIKSQLGGGIMNEQILLKTESMINSMTKKERLRPDSINASRKKRIAAGSGTKVEDVNKLLKQHLTMSKMVKKFGNMDKSSMQKMQRMLNG